MSEDKRVAPKRNANSFRVSAVGGFGICLARYQVMDEKDFKKHLRDLVRGHHHPEEHDWGSNTRTTAGGQKPKKVVRKAKPRKRTGRS